ncbi:hypothetical protein TNCV_4197501 [Trichonephila clavipes]|nr:hypothetical protein TNCV_4197501 [Trichonephila clavipes]
MSLIEPTWDLVGLRLARDPRPAASKDELLLGIQKLVGKTYEEIRKTATNKGSTRQLVNKFRRTGRVKNVLDDHQHLRIPPRDFTRICSQIP